MRIVNMQSKDSAFNVMTLISHQLGRNTWLLEDLLIEKYTFEKFHLKKSFSPNLSKMIKRFRGIQ